MNSLDWRMTRPVPPRSRTSNSPFATLASWWRPGDLSEIRFGLDVGPDSPCWASGRADDVDAVAPRSVADELDPAPVRRHERFHVDERALAEICPLAAEVDSIDLPVDGGSVVR